MKNYLLTALFFTCSLFYGVANQNTSFKFYNYGDVSVTGIRGQAIYYVKPEKTQALPKSVLHLNVEVSQALNRANSYINVLINDQQIQSYALNTIGNEILIPLTANMIDGQGFVKIDVQTNLSITDDRCKDMFNEALWVRVLNTSYIDWVEEAIDANIKSNLWDGFLRTTVIAYPDQLDESDLNALSNLYTFVRTHKDGEIKIYPYSKLPKTATKIFAVGQLNKIPQDLQSKIGQTIADGDGLIYLHETISDSLNQIIFITGKDAAGYRKASNASVNERLLQSTYSNYTLVKDIKFERNSYKFSNISLIQLNNSRSILKGVGSLSSTYNFSSADFGGYSGNGNIHLEARYRPVSTPDKAYYNVYLNRVLLYTQELDRTGVISVDVPFFGHQLLTSNALITEFIYYPSEGGCKAGADEFYAQQDIDRSGLEITAVKSPEHLSFKDFPEIFYTKSTKVFVSKDINSEQVHALALLLFRFNKNVYKDRFYFPEILFSDKLNETEIANNAIIGMLSDNDDKNRLFTNAVIQTGKKFRIFSTTQHELMFNLSDNSNIGIAQIFYQKGANPVVLLNSYGTTAFNMRYAAEALNENMTDAESNICIADSTQTTFLNIDSYDVGLEYEEQVSVASSFWNEYKLWIFVLGVLLIGFAILYIQRKSKRSTDSIINTRDQQN
ncbi:MAG: hypothetical protein RL662_516 [Bacteroidota bacterium]|jgi:hypothetical protein